MINIVNDTADRSIPAAPDRRLHVECLSSFPELATFRDEWDAFVERVGSDIYFTIDWLESWWKYYGSGRELRCLIIRSGAQLVAALPFCVQTLWVGPVPVKVARFVGADSTIPVFSPPVEPGREQEVLGLVLDHFLTKERCDVVSLSPLSGASPITKAAQAICAAHSTFSLARDDSLEPHTIFRLPQTFDLYLSSLQKQQRSNYTRDLAHLSKRLRIAHDVISGSHAIEYFNEFERVHEAQWRATERLGHFGDWPESSAFNTELVKNFAARNRVRFHVLKGNGEPLSIQYGFVFGDTYYWRLPARNPKSELEKFGLGRVGLVKMIESLIAEGIRTIEAGPGHYDYKVRHGGVELPLRRLVVTRTSALSYWKARSALAWSDLLHLLYYRIWFLKLAWRVPQLQSSLWRTWIRTRL